MSDFEPGKSCKSPLVGAALPDKWVVKVHDYANRTIEFIQLAREHEIQTIGRAVELSQHLEVGLAQSFRFRGISNGLFGSILRSKIIRNKRVVV
jgi:hypothetical protein